MEEKVVSRFSKSDLKFLFDKKAIITNYPGSANNWAEGYFSHGSKYKEKILESIVSCAEGCDNLHGFVLLYSMGGGTGSGLGSYILEQLEDFFPNIDRFVACVYSTGSEDVITAPYNMMLATQHLIEYATCVFPFENRALQEITTRKNIACESKFSSISSPFEDMNSIVVNLLLNITSGSRFTGQMNFDVNAIKTNMVPFPKMHFLSSSFSPIGINDWPTVSSNSTREKNFLKACSKDNQMMTFNPLDVGQAVISGMLLGRGDYTLTDMRKYIKILQKKTPFLDWSDKCVKMGLCDVPPVGHAFSMLSLFNSSSVINLFDCMSSKFQTLLNKKAHTHHYTSIEGFDFDFFYECQNTVADIREMYEEIKIPDTSTIPRLQPNINYEYKKFEIE
ncbi:hypothetical protein WA026_007391 [Henosepilachna vigintioctopunctata]|uniref:Tubulin/FtsZ GTPase domain-containing protein n=1 Tax=Henosepilachna vigintioctopunctata TaxID=420089 RepID=A0AAW1UTT1_9CUCU